MAFIVRIALRTIHASASCSIGSLGTGATQSSRLEEVAGTEETVNSGQAVLVPLVQCDVDSMPAGSDSGGRRAAPVIAELRARGVADGGRWPALAAWRSSTGLRKCCF